MLWPLTARVSPGDVLADRYCLEGELGQGSMGVVAQAWHRQLRDRVAVKILHDRLCKSDVAIARFEREARVSFRLRSEHAVRVLDFGWVRNTQPFIVMELLDGRTLSAELAQRGPLPVHQAVSYVLQAAEALAEAHALGIVHRDIKPENLFKTSRPDGSTCIKVLDFGLAKVDEPNGQQLTRVGDAFGTAAYMAPEQWFSADQAVSQSDVWALGVVLFELLTGELPFDNEHIGVLRALVDRQPPRRLEDLLPDAPPGLGEVIASCLVPSPRGRCASVAELAAGLAPYASRDSQRSVARIKRTIGATCDMQATRVLKPVSIPPKRFSLAALRELLTALGELALEKARRLTRRVLPATAPPTDRR